MKRITNTIAIVLILLLCLSFAACSAKQEDSSEAEAATEAAAVTEAPTAAATEAPDYGSYLVGNGVLTLREFTADAETAIGNARNYPNSDGWLVLVFDADGGAITLREANSFIKGISVDNCIYQSDQVLLPDGTEWNLDAAIDNDKDILVIFDAPDGYEPSLDKIHISAPKAD